MAQPDKASDPQSAPDAEERSRVAEEKAQPTVSEPGGFSNDPEDPTNPNEAIERHRRKLRP
jgi:hypothetical protein